MEERLKAAVQALEQNKETGAEPPPRPQKKTA
jgi:hypothetical protein